MRNKNKTKGRPVSDVAQLRQKSFARDSLENDSEGTEEMLLQEKEIYRILVEESPLGVSIIGKDGRYKYINPKFVDIFGYTLKDISNGREWFKKAYPDEEYRSQAISTWTTDLKTSTRGEIRPQTFSVTCKDGSEKIIYFKPVRMETGDQFIIYEDITERKRAENLLRNQHNLAQALGTALRLDEGLYLCLEAAFRVSGMDCGGVYLVDEASGALKLVFHKGLSSDFIKTVSHYDADSPSARLVKAGKPVYTEHSKLGVPLDEVGRREGLHAVAIVPIHHERRVIGCLNIASHALDEAPRFSRDALEAIAAQIGSSLARLKSEEALRQSEERFRALYEDNPTMYFTMDQEGTVLSVNRFGAEQLGYGVEELVGKPVLMVFHPDDKEAVQTQFAQCLRTPLEVAHWEFRKVRKDGSVLWVKEAARAVWGPDGNPVVLVVCEDITDRKRAEEALRDSELQHRVTLDSIGGAIHVVDSELRFVLLNKALKQWNREQGFEADVIDRRLFDVFPFLPHKLRDEYRQVFETGETLVTAENIRIGNREFIIEARKIPFYEGGKVTQVITIAHDITKKARLESIAEAANIMENITHTFAGIRHELGNPINSIKMTLSVLRKNLDIYSGDIVQNYIDRTLGEISKVEYLLKSLRNFSLFEKPKIHNVNLPEFTDQFCSLLAKDFEQKGIKVMLMLSPEVQWVSADPRALQQVMLNLFTNAADAFEGRDNPTIVISAHTSNSLVLIDVDDNGCGIPDDQQENLFKPFYTTKPHGTGLGLVITKKMLAKMDSRIEIKSHQGLGTTVTISIPEGRIDDK